MVGSVVAKPVVASLVITGLIASIGTVVIRARETFLDESRSWKSFTKICKLQCGQNIDSMLCPH